MFFPKPPIASVNTASNSVYNRVFPQGKAARAWSSPLIFISYWD